MLRSFGTLANTLPLLVAWFTVTGVADVPARASDPPTGAAAVHPAVPDERQAAVATPPPFSFQSPQSLSLTDDPITIGDTRGQMADWLRAFDTGGQRFTATLGAAVAGDDPWRLVRVTFPSPVVTPWPENNVVPCELYLPPAPASGRSNPPAGPAVIVLDILHGSAIIPRGIARGLAEKGVAAMYVPMACYGVRRPANNAHEAYYFEHPEKTVENLRQTVMDMRRAKTFLASLPFVAPHRVSITGVSLGGITTALVAGVDGSFDRVVPILAGGDLAAICFHARETRKIREACKAKGISEDQLRTMLEPAEPLTFASRIDARRCLLINAELDEVVPPAQTELLRKAIGQPQTLTVAATHYTAMLYLPTIRSRLASFILGTTPSAND